MRVSIINQPQIETISLALKQSLATLAAAIQTGWNKQHAGDGTHTAITAATLATTGPATVGRLIHGNARVWDWNVAADGPDGFIKGVGVTEASLFVVMNSTPGANGATGIIHGIDGTGRVLGDVVWIVNTGGGTSAGGPTLRLMSTTAVANGVIRFGGNPGLPNTDVATAQNGAVPAVFVTRPASIAGGGPGPFWMIR